MLSEGGRGMERFFNVTGACDGSIHYMVDLRSRLEKMKRMIDQGAYFVINRARQYGKTTILNAMQSYLQNEYAVVSLDFQFLSQANFENEGTFVRAFSRELLQTGERSKVLPEKTALRLKGIEGEPVAALDLGMLFSCLSDWCSEEKKPVVLMIDEVDSAANNQVFLDFLSQLRGYYIHRKERSTFQSVILAGVYDIKNMKQKIRPEGEHKWNSPWNIAADFNVDMNFQAQEIAGMLKEYDEDYLLGMDVEEIAAMLFAYTSGYPFLVSRLCKLMDEQVAGSEGYLDKKAAWTHTGFLEAVKILLNEKNTLFESMVHKMYEYPELEEMVYSILFTGKEIPYHSLNYILELATMLGFIKNERGTVAIANRIFEMVFYNWFLTSAEVQVTDIYKEAVRDKNQFINSGHLNMELLLEKYVVHFNDLYGDRPDTFKEEDGRRYFLLYLRPIINGVGNYYIEAETRNMERTDVIIDYRGEQFVIELKIWRGNAYHERGEKQLRDYLEYYHLEKGYMLSYNFNKKKEIGVKHRKVGNKILVEAVV